MQASAACEEDVIRGEAPDVRRTKGKCCGPNGRAAMQPATLLGCGTEEGSDRAAALKK